jgi:phosphate starvation-inducible protein PhoH and related proteins
LEKTLKLNSNEEAIALYGSLDENLRFAEKEYHVRISARNHRLKITGEKSDVEQAYRFFINRLKEIREGLGISEEIVHEAIEREMQSGGKPVYQGTVRYFHRGKVIQARSENQDRYLAAIRDHDIVIGVGPAGTGKTYLAMGAAIDALKKKTCDRIILTRPAVEAGESLGFLPGDLYAKVNPYLRPLYDALYDMMDYEEVSRYLERGIIEVAPLAYMRGRTLNGSFVILDEGQNCTQSQMKMFLTRLGQSSKAVVTGDVTQIDLPSGKRSGLVEAQQVLSNIKGIKFVYFDETDVVRHHLVQEIIKAYEKYDSKNATKDR